MMGFVQLCIRKGNILRDSKMQQQMGQFQDELKKMEDKLQATEEERD